MTFHPRSKASSELNALLPVWRHQRRELLLQLQALPVRPLHTRELLTAQVESCCQCLMDYLCMGDFLVFARILQKQPALQSVNKPLLDLYRQIGYLTDIALSFNDKYDTDTIHPEEKPAIHKDIRRVTRAMLVRFELEDLLIDTAILTVNGRNATANA